MPESSIGKKLRRVLRLPAPSAPPPAAGTGLLAHSELEFELRQGVVLRALDGSDNPKGVCLALSGAWLKEKRTRTNGSFSAALDLVGLDRKFHGTNATEDRKEKIVMAAIKSQDAYEKLGGTANDRLDKLLRDAGMRYDPDLSAAMEDCVKQHPDPDGWHPVTDIAPTFTSATSEACLPEGRGVCIAVDVNGVGHAVAAYRSRGGSLHFFDPNLGVYKVGNPAGFFAEWAARYAAKGKTLAVTPKGTALDAAEPRTFTCVR